MAGIRGGQSFGFSMDSMCQCRIVDFSVSGMCQGRYVRYIMTGHVKNKKDIFFLFFLRMYPLILSFKTINKLKLSFECGIPRPQEVGHLCFRLF
jgi:hypothetical protein